MPMDTNRCSPSTLSSSSVSALGSKRTPSASENRIPCLCTFASALAGSQTILIYVYYAYLCSVKMTGCSSGMLAHSLSMPGRISWSSHFPRLRRFSRVFENLSRFSGPRRSRELLISIIQFQSHFPFPKRTSQSLSRFGLGAPDAHGACDCNSMAANCQSVRAAQRTTKSSGPRSGCAATLSWVQTLVNSHVTSRSARGLFAAIMSNVRAAPDGERRPCSHS